jgi:Domain of unknown function (DUF4129)
MARWRGKVPEGPVEVIERVEPIEVPILTETKRRLGHGDYDGALRAAYAQVVDDLQRAYGSEFPPGWTSGEILDRGPSEAWGHLPDFVRRLTDLYTPLRFGAAAPPRDPDGLVALLQSIYAARPMWHLYAERRDASSAAGPASPPVVAPAPTDRRSGT